MRSNETRLMDRVKKLHLEPGDSIIVSDTELGKMLMQMPWHTTFPVNIIFAPEGMVSKASIEALEMGLQMAKKIKADALTKDNRIKLVDQSGNIM